MLIGYLLIGALFFLDAVIHTRVNMPLPVAVLACIVYLIAWPLILIWCWTR